ncbi:hypothetical protein FHU41_000896 [Psychromicrobium silvestre]|uniref:Uncharacterized protein n=1 Tax=Psychromicrobium silvestre TaxID=1645614 RepID=A0A7Y9LSA6_9MICC|nr:hypothetical protein [Psychromicrobium silvestre]
MPEMMTAYSPATSHSKSDEDLRKKLQIILRHVSSVATLINERWGIVHAGRQLLGLF